MGKVDDAIVKMIANLEAKTGRPLAAWVKLVQAEKLEKRSAGRLEASGSFKRN
jgi:hypothetical protein